MYFFASNRGLWDYDTLAQLCSTCNYPRNQSNLCNPW